MDKLFQIMPHFVQNLMVSLFNVMAYQKRYGGNYRKFLAQFAANRTLTADQLHQLQRERYSAFVKNTVQHSPFYRELYAGIDGVADIDTLSRLPIVDKEMLRKNLDQIHTIKKSEGIISKTGGTTGKSLEVLFTPDNMQERFAMLDDFRGRFGYTLGKKTAWFSGKTLLGDPDIRRNRFWKTDHWYHVRYYSTFHIKDDYLKYYIADLMKFRPEYMVGFPSTILDIAKYGIRHQIDFPANVVKAVFPTAETITEETRAIIEQFFKTSLYDQYASSEGAPFIFECARHRLHLELQSGVFEVLDQNDRPVPVGRLVVTSFTTDGTPLIRYDIGDQIELEDGTCSCGNHNPMVRQIFGRIDDYVYSPENGKINLGNVSNTLKGTSGIVKFQAIQDDLNALTIRVVTDPQVYTKGTEAVFLHNWRERVGGHMVLKLEYTDDIAVEQSGKFRMVKNSIKHLIDR